MGRIVALVNQKGGVGKTTTAINLGAYLAKFGNKVLLVDVDPQGNASSGLGVRPESIDKGTYEFMLNQATSQDVIVQSPHKNLHVLPATQSLAGANVELVDAEQREFKLTQVLEPLREFYDVILLDAPPSLGLVTINALVAADQVLIPVQSEYYALEGLSQLLATIEMVRANLKPNLGLLGAVITLFDKRTKLAADVAQEIRKYFPGKVFETQVPRNVRLSEAPSYGKSILAYEPLSKGARAYKALAQEIINAWQVSDANQAAVSDTDQALPPHDYHNETGAPYESANDMSQNINEQPSAEAPRVDLTASNSQDSPRQIDF